VTSPAPARRERPRLQSVSGALGILVSARRIIRHLSRTDPAQQAVTPEAASAERRSLSLLLPGTARALASRRAALRHALAVLSGTGACTCAFTWLLGPYLPMSAPMAYLFGAGFASMVLMPADMGAVLLRDMRERVRLPSASGNTGEATNAEKA